MIWFEEGLNVLDVNVTLSEETIEWARGQWSVYRYVIVISSMIGIILTFHTLFTILTNAKFRTIPNMFHVNLFISNLCIMLIGFGFEFPVLLGAEWSVTGNTCQISLQLRRMLFKIALTHFAFSALNRLFAICIPSKPCLVSKTAFFIKSLLAYGVPIVYFFYTNILDDLEGSEILYSPVLKTCVHVTENSDHVR